MAFTKCFAFLLTVVYCCCQTSSSLIANLEIDNFTDHIASLHHTFVLFYRLNCPSCTHANLVLEKIVKNMTEKPRLNAPKFYKLEGPKNAELINYYSQLKFYPALACFAPYSLNITEQYEGEWNVSDVENWALEILLKYERNSSQTISAQQVCKDTYSGTCDKMIMPEKNVLTIKLQTNEITDRIGEIISMKTQDNIDPKSESWITKILLFLLGIIVGVILCCLLVGSPLNVKVDDGL